MTKRLLSCLLALAILLSVSYVSFAENVYTDEYYFKYDLLQKLNILPPTSHEDYGMMRDLSKKAFLSYVCNIYGDYGYEEKDGDLAVKTAESLGLIHEGQDDLYKLINYDEAMTILVRMLDYEMHAQQVGGFPYGYTRIAASIGLADNLSASQGQPLKEHDVVTLLYNTINAPFAQIDHITEEGITYSYISDKTVLHEFRGIYRIDGVVEATGVAALRPDEGVDEGQIRIGGYTYKTNEAYLDLLGLKVLAYAKKADSGYDSLICAIANGNTELVISCEDIQGPDSQFTSLSYYDSNDHQKTAKFAALPIVLYNGQPLGTYTRDKFMPEDGFIRLIDNNQNSGYDVISITEYETLVVDSVSKINEFVTGVYKTAPIVQLNMKAEMGDYITISLDGKPITIRDLAEGDVLKVAKSELNGKVVMDVIACRDRISGTVSGKKDSDDIKVNVDGTDYLLNETYEAMLNKKPMDTKAVQLKIGTQYVFYLDAKGEIAFAAEVAGTLRYGIVYATASDGVFNTACRAKIFTSEGEWKEYMFANKVLYNNGLGFEDRVNSSEMIKQVPQSKNGTINLAAYMLNSDGEICQLYLPETYNHEDGNNGRFNKIDRMLNKAYHNNDAAFGSEVFVKDNAVIWFVDPKALADEKKYQAGNKNLLTNTMSVPTHPYKINEASFAEYFILESDDSIGASKMNAADLFVVDEIQQTKNQDGEDIYNIVGMTGRFDTFSYQCDDPSIVNKLSRGDVVSLYADSTGYVDGVVTYLDFNEDEVFDATASKYYAKPSDRYAAAVIKGKMMAFDMNEKWMKLDTQSDAPAVIRTNNITSVFIYDLDSGNISYGSVNDIEIGAIVVAKVRDYIIRNLVVYQ